MRFGTATILLILCLAPLLLPVSAAAENVMETGGITIWADAMSHDLKSDTYEAVGNVMIVWNDAVLIAEHASLDEKSNEAEAYGKVRLVRGGDVLNCDRIKVNLVTEEGEVTNGDLFSRKSNFHIKGEKFIRLGADKYRLEHGTFTSCNGDEPSWKFTADNLDVNLEDFAIGNNALFYIKDIPSFYTPYMLFPVQRERQSGFLVPIPGNSSKKGFNVDVPYYWAISPSQEAIFDLDIQTKRGAGLGINYNYVRSQESVGKIYAYSIFDISQDKFRGNLVTQQQEWFSPSLVFRSDVNLVSDRTFFLDYSEQNGIYNRLVTDSSVSLAKDWQNYSLAGEVRYDYDLVALNNRQTFQKLPNITFSGMRQRVPGTPLYLALDTSFTNYYREDGIKGIRADARPFAEMYFSTPVGLDISAWGGYRERFYNAHNAALQTNSTSTLVTLPNGAYLFEPGDGTHAIGIAEAGATVTTTLAKIYDTDWGSLKKVRHTMVPELGFNFVQERNQDNLPFYDYSDRVLGHKMASWAITNYLTGKYQEGDASPTYRDLLYLKLSQGWQITGVSKDLLTGTPRDLLTLVDDGRRLTDIRIESKFSPINAFSIFTDSRLSTYDMRFNTISAGFDLKDEKGNSAGISYNYSREVVEYLEGRLSVVNFKPFTFTYQGRFSLDKRGFLESSYSLEYKHQCGGVAFTYHERPVVGDRSFMINFVLAGIGTVAKFKAF